MLRNIPNSSSFSSMVKNEGCSNKKAASPIPSGASITEETEREKAKTNVLLVWSNCSIKLSIKLIMFWRAALLTSSLSSSSPSFKIHNQE